MKRLLHAAVLSVMVLMLHVGTTFAAPKTLGPPAKSPWIPAETVQRPKVVYGDDDRIDVYEETDPDHLTWAASTCALVDESQLTQNLDGTIALETFPYTVDGFPACEGEPFAEQPSAAFCTGFMVGVDLVATAGHCIDEFYLGSTRFVFGFQMTDANTPDVVFDESQVYVPIEIVGSALSNDEDYAVVRVDRPIVAPGSQVLDIRRTGTIPVGTNVGIIGHPSGLPMKIAFGANSVVRNNSPAGYFVTNLDTFGGNSGSPVFNAVTGQVEGILVRGEVDYVLEFACFRSNVVSNTGGRGEDVSKSVTFADLVPGGRGELSLDRTGYGCSDTMTVSLYDLDLRGDGVVSINVTTLQGDQETLTLAEQAVLGGFEGSIAIAVGDVTPGNGVLDVAEGHSILAAYADADNGQGTPAVVTAGATVDCTPPTISNVRIEDVGGISMTVAFDTSESAVGIVHAGTSCDDLFIESQGEFTTTHQVVVRGLDPETLYALRVGAEDAAGNSAAMQPAQGCLTATTSAYRDPFVETFFDLTSDLDGLSVTFTPDTSISSYHACTVARTTLPSEATCGRQLFLVDDAYFEYVLPQGKTFSFYGVPYNRFYIGSNGYVTFGAGDDNYDPTLASHFNLPRISGYYSDLVPFDGKLLVKEFPDRVAITFNDVADYFGDRHTFQMELFYSGAIRLTWLQLTDPYGLVGLSPGGGVPAEFAESDLSGYDACGSLLPNALCGNDRIIICASSDAVYASTGLRGTMGDSGAIALAAILLLALRRRGSRAESI